MDVLPAILSISLKAAPWLLLGLLAAAAVKAFISQELVRKWIGGMGFLPVLRAAVAGAPFPLCSCGAIPVSVALYRRGAGCGATTAFLVGAPGIGVDSTALTYALMGPFMAVARVLGALFAAVITGLLVAAARSPGLIPLRSMELRAQNCLSGQGSSVDTESASTRKEPFAKRFWSGLNYAFTDMLGDIMWWIFAGLILAGVIMTHLPPNYLAGYGSGLGPMLAMVLVGIPLYICASAITPIGAGLLLAGVSPGTVLVLVLAAPITSIATLGVLRREMGNAVLCSYLSGIILTAISLGLLTDQAVLFLGLDVPAQAGAFRQMLPQWLEWAALAVLLLLSARIVVRRILTGPTKRGENSKRLSG